MRSKTILSALNHQHQYPSRHSATHRRHPINHDSFYLPIGQDLNLQKQDKGRSWPEHLLGGLAIAFTAPPISTPLDNPSLFEIHFGINYLFYPVSLAPRTKARQKKERHAVLFSCVLLLTAIYLFHRHRESPNQSCSAILFTLRAKQ
jgi:hypothetical protein